MFNELIEKFFGILNPSLKNKNNSVAYVSRNRIKNTTSPLEFKTGNVILPDNKAEKEIETLYAEIRELQAKNREKISKNKFYCI